MRGCYPTAAERGGRERECVCVCVCVREYEARCSNTVRVGPAWLQRHGCEFVMDVRREARGGGRTKARREKERLYFLCLAKAGRGGIYTQQVQNGYNTPINSKSESGDAWSRTRRARDVC